MTKEVKKARTGAGSGFLTSLHNYGNKTVMHRFVYIRNCFHTNSR